MEPHSGSPHGLVVPTLLPPSRPAPPAPAGRLAGVRVADALREAIIDGRLAAGARLSEAQIAAHYGVSRTPVRQVLAQLVETQAVRSAARTRTRVGEALLRRRAGPRRRACGDHDGLGARGTERRRR